LSGLALVVPRLAELQSDEILPGTRLRSLFAPYYTVEQGFHSLLTLNNSTRVPFVVNPTVYARDGSGMVIAPISLEAHEHKSLDLSDWVATLGGGFATGTLRLDYEGVGYGLGAQVTIVNEQDSLVLDVPLYSQAMFGSSQLEAIWWAPDREASLSLAVVNTTDKDQNGRLAISRSDGSEIQSQPLPLAAHQLRVVDLKDVIAREGVLLGGISIRHDGSPGGVMAQGFIVEPGTGFSANLSFVDPATEGDSKLEGAGLLLGAITEAEGGAARFSGRLFLRNRSGIPLTASPRLQRGNVGADLAQITLQSGEVRELFLPPDSPPQGSEPAGIQIAHNGAPGSLIGYWVSTDASGSLVVETPLRSPGPNARRGGNNPFSLEGDNSSVTYVKNTGQQTGHFVATIWHSGGQYMIGIQTVGAGETVAINIRKLRDEQISDVRGQKLPPDLASGQILWGWHDGPPLVGRLNLMSRTKGIASNMSCQRCCCSPSQVSLALVPAGSIDPVGATGQEDPWETDTGCSGTQTFPLNPALLNWASSNPPVASVDGAGLVSCLSPGTTITGSISATTQRDESGGSECRCVDFIVFPVGSSDRSVVPTVRIAGGNNFIFVGSDPTVTRYNLQQAVGNPSGGTYSWSSSNNRVSF